jgi:hypothetical protein
MARRPPMLGRAIALKAMAIDFAGDVRSDKVITPAELKAYSMDVLEILRWYVLPLVEIPAGAELKSCFGCGSPIYFGRSSTGKPTPVSMRDPRAFAPTSETPGQGINHFIDCTKASDYRVARDRPATDEHEQPIVAEREQADQPSTAAQDASR